MNEEKIFGEIKGIFGQIKKRHDKKIEQDLKEGKAYDEDVNELGQTIDAQLDDFFEFLKINNVTPEEKQALIDLASYKKQELDKKSLDSHKNQEDFHQDQLTHDDLLRVFLVDDKQAEKELKDLQSAFRVLTTDHNEEIIELQDLEKKLKLYDKEHGESIDNIIKELQGADQFLNVMENPKYDKTKIDKMEKNNIYETQMNFNYKEYLTKQFKQKK